MKPTVWLKKTRPGQHSATPLNAWGSYMTTKLSAQRQGLGASCCCRKLVESCFREATGSGTQYYIKFSKHRYVWILPLTGRNSRGKCKRKPKLGTHGKMDPHCQWRVMLTSSNLRLPRVRLFMVADHWSLTPCYQTQEHIEPWPVRGACERQNSKMVAVC